MSSPATDPSESAWSHHRALIQSATPDNPAIPPALQPAFLTGPTGSGKTALGIALAERLGAEIISMDSMAVYRRMDIGTAKPSPDDRRRVPHHLVDMVEPWDEFSLAQYLSAAEAAVAQILGRGRIPLFVGGTPLYLKALLRGAAHGPPPDPSYRARLEREAASIGADQLHQRLAEVDPRAARRIHPNDRKRIVRALEVFQATGVPISAGQTHFVAPANANAIVFCLELPREQLYARINQRVRRMFAAGLVEEVRQLMRLDQPLSCTARQALGYKEVIGHIEGRSSVAETIELVQRRSRQFAKRQLTWFRSLAECRRLPIAGETDPNRLAEYIATHELNR